MGQSGETLYGHNVEEFAIKFRAFGWHAITCNGNSMEEVVDALDSARQQKGKPTVIIANTLKGYGLTSIQGKNGFHGKVFNEDMLPILEEELNHAFPRAAAYHDEQWQFVEQREDTKNDRYVNESILPKSFYSGLYKMRKSAGEALVALGKSSGEIIVIDAEVKNSNYFELFEAAFPKRFVQAFIAEQSMVGIATGYAMDGFIPYVSTFASFLTRAHDQFRMAAISQLALRVIGIHSGVSVAQDGPPQMALEDIALFRTLPNSIVLVAADAVSAYQCAQTIANYHDGISYLRLVREETPCVYDNDQQFPVGGSKVLCSYEHADCLIVAAGVTVHEALMAADVLAEEGIQVAVIDAYSIKPLDAKTILALAVVSNNRIITVEDHYTEGGLGEAVMHAVNGRNIKVTMLAIKQIARSGTPQELRSWLHIDADAIVKAVKKC